jgi:type IV secretion system protein VirD4
VTTVAQHSRAAVIAEDRRQFEMDFGSREALQFDNPTEADSEQVEDALSALDRLEGEILGVSGSSAERTERLVSG